MLIQSSWADLAIMLAVHGAPSLETANSRHETRSRSRASSRCSLPFPSLLGLPRFRVGDEAIQALGPEAFVTAQPIHRLPDRIGRDFDRHGPPGFRAAD